MESSNINKVIEYGEVFTSERLVNNMLDMVKEETTRIESRFLEPACGDGNFLNEILKRKMEVVSSKYRSDQFEFEKFSFQAVGSIYGVEIQKNHVEKCQERLFDLIQDCYLKQFSGSVRPKFSKVMKFVLSRNVVWGDFLTFEDLSNGTEITFSEWVFTDRNMVQRSDYTLESLIQRRPMGKGSLFAETDDQSFVPEPIRVFNPVNFMEICNVSKYDS